MPSCLTPWPLGPSSGEALCCPPRPRRLAASLAPVAGPAHSWGSAVRVLIRRLLLQGSGERAGHGADRQTDIDPEQAPS